MIEVQYDNFNDEYYINYPIDNQTLHMGIQCVDFDELNKKTYFNIYLSIYNKRKDAISNEENARSTGRNIFKSYVGAKRCFKALLASVLEELTPNDTYYVYCGWADNRRRDAYYKFLSKYGFKYGTLPFDNKKVIIKKFIGDKRNEYLSSLQY